MSFGHCARPGRPIPNTARGAIRLKRRDRVNAATTYRRFSPAIELVQYLRALVRLRAGDSEREIEGTDVMVREKPAAFRAVAGAQGWLDADMPPPGDAAIATILGSLRRARSTISTVEPHREIVARWLEAGVGGKAIHIAP